MNTSRPVGSFGLIVAIATLFVSPARAEFQVVAVAPADKSRSVASDAAIQAHFSARFDPSTVTRESVRLWRGSQRVGARITTDLGGVVTVSPDVPLEPDTEYRLEITSGLRSASGQPLAGFVSTFRTGAATAETARTLPPFQKEKIGNVNGVTALSLAPDGALYAATWEGSLLRWELDPATGKPTSDMQVVYQAPRTRITALCFDPAAAQNRRLWIALDDNHGASVCELRFTARIVCLTLPERAGGQVKTRDVIDGLPVADHAVSGLTFGPDGRLYFFVGAATMLGGEKELARETPLSAAVLAADVASPDFTPVNVNTEPPTNYNLHAADAPVRMFATGIREAYDLCWHSNGQLYSGVNQNDTGELTPANSARGLPAVNARPDEPLIRIVAGKYYGHPNPSRDEWVLLGGNPTAEKDPWEIGTLPVGTKPEPQFDPSLLLRNLVPLGGQSADGCAEWRAAGPLHGRLLIGFYTSARTVHTFAFSNDGSRVIAEEPLCDRSGAALRFGAPLDLVIDNEHSRLYVADFADHRRADSAGEGAVWLVTPENPGERSGP